MAASSSTGGEPVKAGPDGVVHLRAPKANKKPKTSYEPHTVLVRLAPGASPADQARIAAAVKGKVVETLSTGYLKIKISGSPEAAAKTLGKDPTVASASLDRARYLDATPNDPLYATYQTYLSTVRMPLAWGLQQAATGAVIAIVDTGVDATHPDLTGRVLAGYNAVTNGTDVTDTVGHGTMVAGIAAANTNNATGVAGAAWNGRILPVKVFTGDVAYDSDVAEGITWAADHGAKVINLSLGGPGDNPALHSAIKYAIGKGAVVVAAAGNTGDDTWHYPAYYPEVLTVAATDANANLTDFSTWGDNVDIAAPGWDIASTYSRQTPNGTNFLYATGAGTSFSAPIVSGVAALIKTKSPALTPAGIASLITSTARDAGPRGIDPYYGHGILDAYRALGGAATTDFPQHSSGAAEPNDVPARAVKFGASISATFDMEGDIDWYRYTAAATNWVTFTAKAAAWDDSYPHNTDPALEIYDADLHLLQAVNATNPASAEQARLALVGGTYYVKVRNVNGAPDLRNYTLTAVPDSPAGYFPFFTDLDARPAGGSFHSNVAIGDVTGDGRPDALLTNSFYYDPDNDYKMFVFPQNSDGSLGFGVRYDTHIGYAEDAGVTVVDANDDGRQDVALTEKAGVEIFLQKADGTLDAGALVPGTAGMRYAVRIDLDDDGDDDLVTLSTSAIGLMIQGPPGQFTLRTVMTDPVSTDVKVGDLNNDGRPDIAAVDVTTRELKIFLQADDGTWTSQSYPAGEMHISDIEVADVTGDGRADVVQVAGYYGAEMRVYAQQPDGRLGEAKIIPTADWPDAVEVTDWDQDGLADIFVTRSGGSTSLYRQATPGTLEPETIGGPTTSNNPGPQTFALGDLNRDGYPDFVATGGGIQFGYNSNGARQLLPQQWVKSTSIADFATTSYQHRSTVTLAMQRTLDPASVNAGTVKLLDGRTGAVISTTATYDPASKTITLYRLTPRLRDGQNVPLTQPGKPYRVVIGGVKDTKGNVFTGYTFTFTG